MKTDDDNLSQDDAAAFLAIYLRFALARLKFGGFDAVDYERVEGDDHAAEFFAYRGNQVMSVSLRLSTPLVENQLEEIRDAIR